MIYSQMVKKACNIMFDAHRDDMDKGGYPYVFHPFFLATQMPDEVSTCVALLHDVVEDHGDRYSFEDLRAAGFPDAVLDAVRLLTHEKDVPYMQYIQRIGTNPVATRVKLADLRHNLDVSRGDGRLPRKYDLYVQAVAYLERITEA